MSSRISLRPLLATRSGADLFMGRSEELAKLKANVEAGANTLVLAERGGGLTSFLNRTVFDLEPREDLRIVVLPGEAARSASDLLAAVADRLVAASTREPASVAAPNRPEYASDVAAVLLWRLERIAQVAESLESRAIVVIDGICSPAVAHTMFGQLRNELWQIEPITWVLGGAAAHRGRYLEPPADAFWESVIDLPPLSKNELFMILVKHHLALSNGDQNTVLEAANGNPMALLLAARNAEDGHLPGQQEHDAQLSESAARLMYELQINGPASASDKGLLTRLGWSRGRAQQVLKALEQAGLVAGELAPADGGPGRPRKVYRLTEAAR